MPGLPAAAQLRGLVLDVGLGVEVCVEATLKELRRGESEQEKHQNTSFSG